MAFSIQLVYYRDGGRQALARELDVFRHRTGYQRLRLGSKHWGKALLHAQVHDSRLSTVDAEAI